MSKSKSQDVNIPKIATIRQVAQLAGVSIATVSRVFADGGMVSAELAERVHAAARSLNYQPNRIARNLRTQTTNTVALVISDVENPFFTSVVRGVEHALRAAGYTLLLADSDEDPQLELDHLFNLRAEGVAGVIIAPAHGDARRYEQLIQNGMRMVAIDRAPRDLRVDRVTVNNLDGARAAVKHLVEHGHSRIGFIAGLPQISTSAERQSGYEQEMKANHLPVPDGWIQYGDYRQESGYRAMKNLFASLDRPTAVISANNLMTLGALQAIYEQRLCIPGDMAMVGFDDMSWASSLNPPLTAVAQPTRELGSVAAQLLLDRIKDPARPVRHVILDTELIVRASSGPHRLGA